MNKQNLKALIVIAVALTIVSWVLGMLIVRKILPAWAMLAANIPFGYVYVWTEAHWADGNYIVDGKIVSENLMLQALLIAHVAQICLYYSIWLMRKRFSQMRLTQQGIA